MRFKVETRDDERFRKNKDKRAAMCQGGGGCMCKWSAVRIGADGSRRLLCCSCWLNSYVLLPKVAAIPDLSIFGHGPGTNLDQDQLTRN